MHSIRQHYASSSSASDEEEDASILLTDDRAPGYRAATFRSTANVPVVVIETSLAPTKRKSSRRSLDRGVLADEKDERAYKPKRRCRGGNCATASDNLALITTPESTSQPLFDGVQEAHEKASRTPSRRDNGSLRRLERSIRLREHSKAISSIQWNMRYPSLVLSASMDASVRVWSAAESTSRRVLMVHNSSLGVKSAKWMPDGRSVLSGGYDDRVVLSDVETGHVKRDFSFPCESRNTKFHRVSTSSNEAVTAVSIHPSNGNMFVIGTSRGGVLSFDLREPGTRPALNFGRGFGEVLDLLFLPGSNSDTENLHLVTSANITTRDASNQSLLVWDFRSSLLLYDRLDAEMRAFPCLRRHPTRAQFVAQSSSNRAYLFSSNPPFKCVKQQKSHGKKPIDSSRNLCYSGGHQVAGYPIQCSFSEDGELFATGDTTGRLVLYEDKASSIFQSIKLNSSQTPVICAEFNQFATRNDETILMTGSYNGAIDVMRFEVDP